MLLCVIIFVVLVFSSSAYQHAGEHSITEEVSMLELIKSLGFALLMVPVVMVLIMGLIYGLGSFFNLLSKAHVPHHHHHEESK
ncbi:multidrug efflux pump-associated protein AcrZ [Providencia alcalifaciens RIMD 1656011]|uniref:Multidrug efflux pump accessory protein AcrZ n=2 Tax=Providencia alcalifaciens TaxID=126385 RepID=B6XIS4_9GAMM|nr:hypothetical protein PROVALCAL_03269 [Providencia alcalifaciens DSM 30120]ETT05877.1 multidrug efflux pump-associated protein AcrZ [Providencia alcalifaciens F90-2004]EUC94094.1 multidrug efflux pump-associated protein AcrZ [Providencia alcalifaciens PAL-2]EUD04292.1 multidrug efflux pump-associated protein AcrZ [Providencia alcalifaciens RIMD 1656011]EUD08835.1 multidrug efflux pump-associated protein AcrZ [Providencia alcalifaciens R90-1475]